MAGSATFAGLVDISKESLEGASMAVVVGDQELPLAGATRVLKSGMFLVKLSTLVPSGPFQVQIKNAAGEVFSTEVESLSGRTFVHINTLTTLCAAYHQLNPSLSIAQARADVHAFLQIPPRGDLGDEVANVRYSNFSQRLFLSRARAHPGGLSAFNQQVAAAIGGTFGRGGARATSTTDPSGSPIYWYNDQPQLAQLLDATVCKMLKPPCSPASDAVACFTASAPSPGEDGMDPVFKGLMSFVRVIATGVSKEKTHENLSTLSGALDALNREVSQLETYISKQFAKVEFGIFVGTVANDVASLYNQLTNMGTVASDANKLSDTPPSGSLDSLITDVSTFYKGGGTYGSPSPSSDQASADLIYNQLNLTGNLGGLANGPMGQLRTPTCIDYYMYSSPSPSDSPTASPSTSPVPNATPPNLVTYQNTMNYYVGAQIAGAVAIAMLLTPYDFNSILYKAGYTTQSFNFTTFGQSDPAQALRYAMGYTFWPLVGKTTIADMVAEESSYIPYTMVSDQTIFEPDHKYLWYYSNTSDVPDQAIPFVTGLQLGGISKFALASHTQVQDLFKMAATLKGYHSPSSYTGLLKEYGFQVEPGDFLVNGKPWYNKKGFVCIDSPSQINGYDFDVWFVDDENKSYYIGYCCPSKNGSSPSYAELQKALDSESGVTYQPGGYSAPEKVGPITGPMLIVFNAASDFAQQSPTPSLAYVTLGCYDKINLTANASVQDPWSNGGSCTQQLVATADGSKYQVPSNTAITNEVYWTSSSPAVAPISNVAQPPYAYPSPDGPAFTPLPHAAGTVHWLPGSAGVKNVAFTASRYDPYGNLIQSDTLYLDSPITSSPAPSPSPYAIDVWPSYLVLRNSALQQNSGYEYHVWVTRYLGGGTADDASSSNEIQFTSSDPRIVYSGGRIYATASLDDYPIVTLTFRDTNVAGSTNGAPTQPQATCTLVVTP